MLLQTITTWMMMIGDWWLVIGDWWLMIDDWWLMIDDWWLMIDDWWLVIDDWWLMIDDWWLMMMMMMMLLLLLLLPEGSWRALGGLRVLRAGMGYKCMKLRLLNSVFLTHKMCGPLRRCLSRHFLKDREGGGDVALGELLEGSRRAPSAPCRNGL